MPPPGGATGAFGGFGGTVRWRLTLWHTAILAFTFAIFGVVVERIGAHNLETEVDRHLPEHLQTVTSVLTRTYVEDPRLTPEELSDEIGEISLSPDTALRLELTGGRTFTRNASALSESLLASWKRSPAGRGMPWTGWNGAQRRRIIYLEGSPQSDFNGRVLLARDLSSVDAQLRELRRTLALVLSSVLVLAAVGGYWLSARALRPVAQITVRARHIEAHDLNQRLEVENPRDEFGRLAQVLNDLFERLERAFLQQRRFLADAAHELRTPVAVIRSQMDVALQRVRPAHEYASALESIRKESAYLSAIVDDLLLIARADAAQFPAQKEMVDLVEIVDECCRSLRPLAQERNLQLHWEVGSELAVCADGRLLHRAAANLLSNAIHFTPAGGCISVSVRREPDRAVLEVADTGIGIAPEDLSHVFERFYRARQPAGQVSDGSGLGLAIVGMIAKLHDGSVTVASRPGAGSTFSLGIPFHAGTVDSSRGDTSD
jgi:heavy metal sensor kinase